MAHQLEIRNGEASMMYVGEVPWHGLGTELKEPATAREAIKAAKLDWEVMKLPLFVHKDSRAVLRVEDRYGIVRSDLWKTGDCVVLGIVGPQYTPLQNSEAFTFFDPIVGEGEAVFHTAGVLDDGRRVWMLAKLPDSILVVGDDVVDKYLLLSNSHDGSSAVQVKFTPIRVVCQNTLTMALSEGRTVRVTHTRNVKQRLANAQKTLGIIRRRYDEIEEAFKRMVQVQMRDDRLEKYLAAVFPDPGDPEDKAGRQRTEKDRMWAAHFFHEGQGNTARGAKGTLWAAYNGVTELIDHRATAHQTEEKRLESLWFGDGYHVKARAYAKAVELTRAPAN
jgi:phage/plasmid-like protein (TIGR03299 family)